MNQDSLHLSRALANSLLLLARELANKTGGGDFRDFLDRHGVLGFLERFGDISAEHGAPPDLDGVSSHVKSAAFALKTACSQDWLNQNLTEHGIRFIGLKGPSLSQLLFGDITSRAFGDLDLLISPDDAAYAIEQLEKLGFLRTNPRGLSPGQETALLRYGKAQNFVNPAINLSLDLHWKLLSPWVGNDFLPFSELWERSQILQREGLKPWRTLGNEDTLVFIALHGSQDGWCQLKQFLDLALALQNLKYDQSEVLRIAGPRAVLVERSIELCRLLLDTDPSERTFDHFGCYREAFEEWIRFATGPSTPQMELLRRDYWSCSAPEATKRSLLSLFNPSLEDIQSVGLPTLFVGAYPIVRAFRLLRKALS